MKLPNKDIIVVHRSDGSGTTFIFTDYLTKVSPEWKTKVGTATSVNWPVGLGGKGNEGVTQQVKQTEGAIGYVELIYAASNKLALRRDQERGGQLRRAHARVGHRRRRRAPISTPNTDFRVSITNAPGAEAYPISSFTWLLVKPSNPDAVKAKADQGLPQWMLTPEAQQMAADLHYAPLPVPLIELIQKRVAPDQPSTGVVTRPLHLRDGTRPGDLLGCPQRLTAVSAPRAAAAPTGGAFSLEHASRGDRIFRSCSPSPRRAIPVLLGFLVYELWIGSAAGDGRPFGFDFVTTSDWDPVADKFGALPLIFGTLLSSLLALLIAVPLSLGVAIFLTEFAPTALRQPIAFLIELLAAIPSVVYGLWGIFVLIPLLRATVFPAAQGRVRIPALLPGPDLRPLDALGRHHPRDHGHAVHHVGVPRGPARRARQPARGGAGARRHPLGSGRDRGRALRPLRHHRRHHPRARPRAGRDDGGHDAHRQPARDRGVALRAGLHHGGGDRQRVRRGGDRHALLGADLRRAGALRGDGAGQRRRAAADLAGRVGGRGEPARCEPPASSAGWTSNVMVGAHGRCGAPGACCRCSSSSARLVLKGAGSLSLDFFTKMPAPAGETGGGVAHAIVGTLLIVGTACLIGLPVGIGAGHLLRRSIPAAGSPGSRASLPTC